MEACSASAMPAYAHQRGGSKHAPPPDISYRRPVVLVDSGASVAESVFLDKMRWWLHGALSDRILEFNVPCVWILYPNSYQKRWHGAYPVNEYDKWEIRPVRWRDRRLDPQGLLATVAAFEDGCKFKGIKAPWREWNSKRRRAVVVYLSPNRRCLDWARRNWRKFKKAYNIPELVLGPPWNHAMPVDSQAWVDGCWAFDLGTTERMKEAFWGKFGYKIPWFSWWEDDQIEPTHRFGIAQTWEDYGSDRYPGMARKWAADAGGSICDAQDNGTWQSVIGQTGCKYYILATTRESVPYDAMIALARGSVLVAPDVALFRNLPGEKLLFPAYQSGDRIQWAQSEARAWIKTRIKKCH